MGLTIEEFFGYPAGDASPGAMAARASEKCPFLEGACTKLLRDGIRSGVCTVKQTTSTIPTICCPNRLYAQDYMILHDVAKTAFGDEGQYDLRRGDEARLFAQNGNVVAVFGRAWGKEIRIPGRNGKGGYFVDWVLAKLDKSGEIEEFVAVEVQTIDTTGNYHAERKSLLAGNPASSSKKAGLNWENVSKRIIPQLVLKGQILQRESLCKKGLFFICPTAVYGKIMERLGSQLGAYHRQPSSITFSCYDLGQSPGPGAIRPLLKGSQFTSDIHQVSSAFSSPVNLPSPESYSKAIRAEL